MDVSSSAQRLASLRWLTASIAAGREQGGCSVSLVDAAAAVLGPHHLLAPQPLDGQQHEREISRFMDAVLGLLKSGNASDAAVGAKLLGLCCTASHPAAFAASFMGWGEALLHLHAKGHPGIQISTASALSYLLNRVQELNELQGNVSLPPYTYPVRSYPVRC
jgi:hypothetical protein